MYPYLPVHVTRPKEVRKLYVVHLPERCYFAVRPLRLIFIHHCCTLKCMMKPQWLIIVSLYPEIEAIFWADQVEVAVFEDVRS